MNTLDDIPRVEHYPSGVSYCYGCGYKLILMADEDEDGNVYQDTHEADECQAFAAVMNRETTR